MAGAARFLYGLALGISLGIVSSRLLAAASSGRHRPPARASLQEQPREEAVAR